MTLEVLDCLYTCNFRLNGQGQLYFKYFLLLVTTTPFILQCKLFIFGTMVDEHQCDIRVKGQGRCMKNLLNGLQLALFMGVFIFGTMIANSV